MATATDAVIWQLEVNHPGWSTMITYTCTATDHGHRWWEHTHCYQCGMDDTVRADQTNQYADIFRCTACGHEVRQSIGD